MPITNHTRNRDRDRDPALPDLRAVDLSHAAYVRCVYEDGQTLWAIHNPEGERIGLAPSRDLAFAAIIQHDLEPMSVH